MNSHNIRCLIQGKTGWLLPVGLTVILLSCQSGDQRSQSQGTAIEGKIVTTQDAAPISSVPGNADANGSSNSTGKTGEQFGRSLEQCTAEKKAWRAVVNSGSSPSECSDPLVSWCCTRQEILARFPTMASTVESEFKKFIDDEKHVLYHCSTTDGGNRTTFHMAKTDGAQIFYRTVYVEKVFPVDTGSSGSDCPVVTTKDLAVETAASSNSETTGTEIGETDEEVQP